MKKTVKHAEKHYSCLIGSAVYIIFAIVFIIGLPVTATAGKEGNGGILQQGIENRQDVISVKLVGVTKYELTEMFNDLLIRTPGVVEAKRYRLRLEPDNPDACVVEWQVRLENSDVFQLETKLYRMIRELSGSKADVQTSSLSIQPTAEDFALFNDIRPWRASIKEIQFVLNRTLRFAPACEKRSFTDGGYWRVWPDTGFE